MKDKKNVLCLGISLLTYGILSLMNIIGILNFISSSLKKEILDWRTFILISAISFLIFQPNKTIGLILMILALFLRLNIISNYILEYNNLLMPLSLITFGFTFLIISLKK